MLLNQLSKHTDLKSLDSGNLGKIFQVLYVCTGCDYVSYFKHHGKTNFYNTLFDYAKFITGDTSFGTPNMTEVGKQDCGFYSFIRLVGCEYFRSVASKFICQLQVAKADLLFDITLSEANDNIRQAHSLWLDKIRSVVSLNSENEDYYLPSTDALELHWKRVCWVAQVWESAAIRYISYPDVVLYGWTISNGVLSVVWDSEDNFQRCEKLVKFWTRGCQCKKACLRNCGCRRGSKSCGPGCLCISSCTNAPSDPSINSLVLALGSNSGNITCPTDLHQPDLLTDESDDEVDTSICD